uniref:U2A'/phosphoprotein 32 family A C-terminal domain-containing protein n=1 Tax=Cuerna arida TaxID=1464854 RepID=A0A1B6GE27_9HEMI
MEKRIELEKRGRDAKQIHVLYLDNTRSTTIVGLTNEFVNLKYLSLVNVGLVTLKGFPELPNLKQLELSDNLISNGLHHLKQCKKLAGLNLSGNKISQLKELEPLKEFKNLRNLDLFHNEITSIENYRSTVSAMIPTLQFLDEIDVNSKDSDDDDSQSLGGDDEDDDFDSSDEEPANKSLDLRAVYNDNLDELSDDEFKLENNCSGQMNDSDDDDDDDDDDDEDDVGAVRGRNTTANSAENQEDGEDEEEEDDEDEEEEEEFKENLSRGKKRKFDETEGAAN